MDPSSTGGGGSAPESSERSSVPAGSVESSAAYGIQGCLYVAHYSIWTRSVEGPKVDGDECHVGWVRAAGSETDLWAKGLYLNEVSSSYDR